MESSLYLPNRCTMSSPPLQVLPSTPYAARTTKLHLGFWHSSISFPKGSAGHPIPRTLTPIICAVDGVSTPPPKDEGDDSIMRSGIGVTIALACVIGIIGCSYMINQKAITPKLFPGSSKRWNISQPADKARKLKDLMGRRSSSLVSDELKRSFDKDPDGTYFMTMELIKMLINEERYKDAGSVCKQLEGFYATSTFSPLRKKGDFFLYKVLIYGMMGNMGEAEKAWNNFKRLLEESLPPLPTP